VDDWARRGVHDEARCSGDDGMGEAWMTGRDEAWMSGRNEAWMMKRDEMGAGWCKTTG